MRPRSLTEKERAFTRWLIENSGREESERERYLAQLADVRVVARCDCGCASIDFAADQSAGISPFGEFVANDGSFGVFVFESAGRLAGVEIYPISDKKPVRGIPEPDELRRV